MIMTAFCKNLRLDFCGFCILIIVSGSHGRQGTPTDDLSGHVLMTTYYKGVMLLALLVTNRVPEIGFLGTRNQPKNEFKASWTRFLLFFCQIFGIFDDFSKFCSTFSMHHFEKSSNMPKIGMCTMCQNLALFTSNRRPKNR